MQSSIGGHHLDMALDRQEAGAAPAACAGAGEHGVVLWFQMRCALDGHGAADATVGGVNLSAGKAKRHQKIKVRVLNVFSRNLEGLGQKLNAKRPFVENEFNVEGVVQPAARRARCKGALAGPPRPAERLAGPTPCQRVWR